MPLARISVQKYDSFTYASEMTVYRDVDNNVERINASLE